MSTNMPGGDPLAAVQATTKGIAQGLGVLFKQVAGIDPSGQINQVIAQMIEGVAAIEEAVQNPPPPPQQIPQGFGPMDEAGLEAQAMMEQAAMQQGGGVPVDPTQGGF